MVRFSSWLLLLQEVIVVLRIAIVDDEDIFRKRISGFLGEYLDKRKIEFSLELFGSGREVLELGTRICNFGVFFLDVSMRDVDGIAAARKIREYAADAVIVFVTAYIDYSIEGYKVNALRYVLKDNENLADSLNECMEAVMREISKRKSPIHFHFNEGEKTLSEEQIMYIESRLHKLEFHMTDTDHTTYTMYRTLNEIEQKLDVYDTFLRIHQSYLVNLKYVEMVNNYTVSLSNGEVIKAAKSRYSNVRKEFMKYIGEV